MGCDIHLFLERKRKNETTWKLDPGHEIEIEDLGDGDTNIYLNRAASGRDYSLFGALSNGVRGWNGIPRRGIPDDTATEILEEYNRWGSDAHSTTHVSLNEYVEAINHRYDYFADDYDYQSTISAFASWQEYTEINSFMVTANYCLTKVEDSKADAILLDNPNLELEYRLVMFFDN